MQSVAMESDLPVEPASRIGAVRGVVMALAVMIVPRLWGALFMLYDAELNPYVRDDSNLVRIAVVALSIATAVWLIKSVGGVDVRSLFAGDRASFKEISAVLGAAVLLGFFQFVHASALGHKVHEPLFLLFVGSGLMLNCVLNPFYEEVNYRGICFAAVRRGSGRRVAAYTTSTLLFTLSHSKSYVDLIRHLETGLGYDFLFVLVLFGLTAAYIYERTGKLMLCVLLHSAANSMQFLGVITGHFLLIPH